MTLLPVALALFYRRRGDVLEVWTQIREDDGVFHGLLEFPGGGIEPGEMPMDAAVREVQEEVGISVNPLDGKFLGIYPRETSTKTILLYVHIFEDQDALKEKGEWLRIEKPDLSQVYEGKIPFPNHRIIDDLYKSLYSGGHE
jgi:8-oxo-dGTP diphosphatase